MTEQKLDAEAELQKFISDNENLKSRVKEMERENTNIKKTVQVNMEAVQSAELERLESWSILVGIDNRSVNSNDCDQFRFWPILRLIFQS